MARISFVLAVLAVAALGSGAKTTKKTKTFRQSCVDANAQVKTEGSSWLEGVNGCLQLTCTSGQAVGTDYCSCTYPDSSKGKTGDVWYSVPTCTSCACTYGNSACTSIANCILPATTTATATATVTSGYTCTGPDNLKLNPNDKYIEGCMNCTCTASGLVCSGMVECPAVETTASATDCFMGFLGFIADSTAVQDEWVSNGYVFKDSCDECVCTDGTFICKDTCNTAVVTTTATATATATQTVDGDDDTNASLDCDVGDGIVVAGDTYDQTCAGTGATQTCTCVAGALACPACATTTATPTPTPYVCTGVDGSLVNNGGFYMAENCTNCTCINGIFACRKVCDRDCKSTSGKVYTNGQSSTATCSKCKCKDATLTCENTCAGKTCKIPNSKSTVKPGSSKKIDSCMTCKCTTKIVLECRDKCETTATNCICEGKTLKTGKSMTSKCQKCTCNKGKLSCKKTC